MTTVPQSLSERLRAIDNGWPILREAADALDAQAAEIERLRECVFRSNEKYVEVDDRLVDATDGLEAKDKEIERLREDLDRATRNRGARVAT